jgi:hypothetical protein|tara:strand:- start:282 stop:1694 length:1413 start_codon:yes stop_codon:yes gene_type:complete
MIKTYNDFFTDELLIKIHQHLDSPMSIWINQRSNGTENENTFGMYEVSHIEFFNTELVKYINTKLDSSFLLERVYFNRQDTNQDGSFHQDTEFGYTFLSYLNVDYQECWGGKTIFKIDDETDEVIPYYNKSVLFKGNIFHKGMSFKAEDVPKRISLAFKFIPKEVRLTKEEVKKMVVKISEENTTEVDPDTVNVKLDYDSGTEVVTKTGDDSPSDTEKMTMELMPIKELVFAKINFHPDIVEEINSYIDDEIIPNNKSNANKLVGQYSQDERSAQLVFDFESDVGQLLKGILDNVATAYLQQGYERDARAITEQCWTNHGYAGDYNPYHDHPYMGVYPSGHMCTAGLSGFLWLKVPECIRVLDDKPDTITGSNGKINGFTHLAWGHNTIHDLKKLKFTTEKYLKPKEGELWIFPNWLKHQVYPFFGEGERRSLAMNWGVYDSEKELKKYMNEDQIKAFDDRQNEIENKSE